MANKLHLRRHFIISDLFDFSLDLVLNINLIVAGWRVMATKEILPMFVTRFD